MDAVHIHLFLNHVPIIGSFAAVLLLAYGTIRKSDEVMRAAFVALILTAIAAIPVYLTGEPAEEVAEQLPGVSEAFIEAHEDAGKLAMIAAMVTGVFSLISMFLFGRMEQAGRMFAWGTIILSLITAGAMARAGNLGGQIRHTEIRAAGQNSQQMQPGENRTSESKKNEKDNDDH